MGILSKKKEQVLEKDIAPTSIHEENQLLKSSLSYLKTELSKFKELPLLVCEARKVLDNKVMIKVPNGSQFLVNISGNIKVETGDTVLVEQRSLTVVQKLEKSRTFDIEDFVIVEKPNINWSDVGGLEEQINEIKEVVELPLLKPEIFKNIGIEPPKGILLYGPPGTGKTLLAKAVATSAKATFIEIVASELVQKFIGEGAKLVREIFSLAREKAPSIIFIDEIDALAAERLDAGVSGEREVQRTFMQLLTEIDGFKSLDNVKIIGATNRFDVLDPALLRPGRFDRLIEIPLPDEKARMQILKIHSKRMKLNDVDYDEIVSKIEGFNGAEVRAICTEAGYFAIRENRNSINHDDFSKAVEKLSGKSDDEEYAEIYG
ncbi:proteasome-activating nucleotidase [Candidatus Woesearchaeota archaeon]|nr:MAG: proteasome regulatory subunit [archaeon GW2011_AR18]MBS3161170.1 proteasome-activating nucleotidase [Candidatus Woesearchaeota archaeon]HIH25970.1 proteasome-activating nucleotidase [Nanoarchaeota archaeon]